MGKAIPSEFGQWWDMLQVPSLEMGSSLEVETPLEVDAEADLGKAERGQGEADMGLGQGLRERGSWMGSIWRRGHGAWIWLRDVCGGRQWERHLCHTTES